MEVFILLGGMLIFAIVATVVVMHKDKEVSQLNTDK